MPTYVYKCEQCVETEQVFELKRRFSDPPLTECPKCGSDEIRKLINSVGVVFKGSGFYVTDNRGKNSAAPSTKSDAKAESGTSGSDSAETSTSSSESTKTTKKESSAQAA